MRARLVFRRGRAHWLMVRGVARGTAYTLVIPRRNHVWHVACLGRWGCSVFRTYSDGVLLWEYPGFKWYGSLKAMKRRRGSVQPSDATHLAAIESSLFSKLHPLIAHCCVTKYDDGEARKPGWWTLKTMGSAWVVEVKDPDTCCRLVCVQQTADDALMLASVLLESEEAPWEPDPWLAQQAAKNRKK